MLTPFYLWKVADKVVDIWEELNNWAIKDITERLMAADLYEYSRMPGAARWRAWVLNQSGMHYENMIKKVSSLSQKSENEVADIFIRAGLMTLQNETKSLGTIGSNVISTFEQLQKDKIMTQILEAAYRQTNGELKNFTRTTADASNKLFIDTIDKAYFERSTGMRSYNSVIKDAVNTVAKQGITVTYHSGHVDTVETAVRRAIMTGVNQGTAKIVIENCKRLGIEYVTVSKHMGARVSEDPIANHAGWQGGIYKIDGSTSEYRNLEEATGYPKNPLGLCGYNCRHDIAGYRLGETNPWDDVKIDKEENEQRYELSQKQRRIERSIRATKRKLLGFETAIDKCKDENIKFELQMSYDQMAERLKRQNKSYREFCEVNELREDRERLSIANWSADNAYRDRGGASRYEKVISSGKISDKKAARDAVRNTHTDTYFNQNYDYSIKLDGYSKEVNAGLSKAARNVAENGSRDRYEYLQLVDLKTGRLETLMTDKEYGSVGGKAFWDFIEKNQDREFAFVHNHNSDGMFSITDMSTLLRNKNIKAMLAVRNDAVIYIAERKGNIIKSGYFDSLYEKELEELNIKSRSGKITASERAKQREILIVENLLRDYTKQGGLYEINGQK